MTIVEVGPRDGLQNEPAIVPTQAKIAFIEALADAGASDVEVTSFVSPSAVPQLADAEDVMRGLSRRDGVRYMALVPNERGLDRALAVGVDSIALFAAATDAFSQANIRCTIDESFNRFTPVVKRASANGVWVRGYVSVAFDCPYGGRVDPTLTVAIAARLFDLGCAEVSIADTIGTASPEDVDRFMDVALCELPIDRLAMHFHDTRGTAIDNVEVSYSRGVRRFDASAGGLGGCPFAPGAPGNVATERVVDWCSSKGIASGIDRNRVVAAVDAMRSAAGRLSTQ